MKSPGVSGTNESSSGLYVRGGTPDQNLVLLDGFTVYHVDHFYGFFSAFNSGALKDIQLFKGGFPAEYGGRISSGGSQSLAITVNLWRTFSDMRRRNTRCNGGRFARKKSSMVFLAISDSSITTESKRIGVADNSASRAALVPQCVPVLSLPILWVKLRPG